MMIRLEPVFLKLWWNISATGYSVFKQPTCTSNDVLTILLRPGFCVQETI